MSALSSKQKREIDMLNGPFLKKILIFALPIMLSGILQLFYTSADIIIVGRFSAEKSLAQAAVNSTGSLCHLVINVFMGFAVGVNVAVARRLGASDREGASKVVHTAIMLSLICGVIVAIIGFIFSRTFLVWMKSPSDVIELSSLYLKIYFLGSPFLMLYEFCAAILRAKGETKKPLYYLLISGATNIVLNIIFVVAFKMSVAGVALATILTEGLSAFLVIRLLVKTDDSCKLYLKKIKIHFKELKDIIFIGFPASIQGSMFSISNVIIQSSINNFGSTVMAGNGNAASIEGYLNVIVDGVVKASISFIGQNYGAKNKQNILSVMKKCLLLMTIFCLISSGLVILLRSQLLAIFNPDKSVIDAGIPRILINCGTYLFFGYMQLLVGFMRGLGKGVLPMLISICGICVFRVLWIFLVLSHFNTIICLFISYPISWLLTASAQGVCLLLIKNKTFEKMYKTETKTA